MVLKLLRSSFFIIAAFVILKVFGLFREIALAYVYGAGALTDAYVIARSVTDTLAGIAAASAGTVFVAVCARIKDENEKRHTARSLITLFCAIGFFQTAAIAAFPYFFVRLFAANPAPEVSENAAALLRFMSVVCIPSFANEILAANLRTNNHFFRASVYQATVNIFVIAFIFIAGAAGNDTLIGIGFAAGYVFASVLLLIFNKKAGFTFRPEKILPDENIKAFFALLPAAGLSVFAVPLFQVIDRAMAASAVYGVAGTVSSLSYAAKIQSVFVLFIGTAVTTAFLPDLSKYIAAGDSRRAAAQIKNALFAAGTAAVPLTVGVMVFARLIIKILLERGEFTAADTETTAVFLSMYAAGLAPQCFCTILAAVMLARHETKALLAISLITVIFGVALKFIFPENAAALSTSIAAYVFAAMLFIELKRKRAF
jgi:putative peptidoglycan lipid II flippase